MEGGGRLAGRVAVVTGAGRGIGRAHALALAEHGAAVVVNDLGGSVDGAGRDPTAAEAVVAEIAAFGGRSIADTRDVADWSGAEAVVASAVATFGSLDVLVNNAGILRPRTIVGMTEEEWDHVVHVHLRGTAAMTHFAAVHWRERSRRGGPLDARLVNTTSASGLYGNGQSNYASAKAGVAAFTLIAAQELARYGVTANAIAPVASTRMAEGIVSETHTARHVAQLVAWLVSPAAAGVSGRIFNVGGGHISVAEGWHAGAGADKPEGWDLDELDAVVPALLERAAPPVDIVGYYPEETRPPTLAGVGYPSDSVDRVAERGV